MNIDQNGFNSLLYTTQPKSTLDALREKQKYLLKELSNGITNSDAGESSKQVVAELEETNNDIQQAIYEEKSTKLELERLENEEATAKNLRGRETAMAKHEHVLNNKCMSKLLSANCKYLNSRTVPGGGIMSFPNEGLTNSDRNGSPAHSGVGNAELIDRDLKESVKFGIAAAQVARRRKNNQIKETVAKSDDDKNEAAKKKLRKKSIDISV